MPDGHLPQDSCPARATAEPTQPENPMFDLAHTASRPAAISRTEQGQAADSVGHAIDTPPDPHHPAAVWADREDTGIPVRTVRDSVPRHEPHPIQAEAEWS